MGMVQRQAEKVTDFIVIEAAHENRVQFQILKTNLFRRRDATEDIRKTALAGEGGKALWPQGIQADIQPVHTGLPQGSGQLLQAASIGSETQFRQPGDFPQPSAQLQNSPAHQRFSPGDADFSDAARNSSPADFHALLNREDVRVRSFGNPLRTHAIHTAIIAQICHGEAQIVNFPAIAVLHKAPPFVIFFKGIR